MYMYIKCSTNNYHILMLLLIMFQIVFFELLIENIILSFTTLIYTTVPIYMIYYNGTRA